MTGFCDCGMPFVLDQDTVGDDAVRFHCVDPDCDEEEFVDEPTAKRRVGRETFLEVA